MRTKNYPPTAAHQRWHKWVRENYQECRNCGAPATDLHHILGSAAKHNRVWIGQCAVTMLCDPCNHNDLVLPDKPQQLRDFLQDVVVPYWLRFNELPPGMGEAELLAIASWHQ